MTSSAVSPGASRVCSSRPIEGRERKWRSSTRSVRGGASGEVQTLNASSGTAWISVRSIRAPPPGPPTPNGWTNRMRTARSESYASSERHRARLQRGPLHRRDDRQRGLSVAGRLGADRSRRRQHGRLGRHRRRVGPPGCSSEAVAAGQPRRRRRAQRRVRGIARCRGVPPVPRRRRLPRGLDARGHDRVPRPASWYRDGPLRVHARRSSRAPGRVGWGALDAALGSLRSLAKETRPGRA